MSGSFDLKGLLAFASLLVVVLKVGAQPAPQPTKPHQHLLRSVQVRPALSSLPVRRDPAVMRTRLTLFPDRSLQLDWQEVHARSAYNYHRSGKVVGDPFSAVTLTVVGDAMLLEIQSPAQGQFEVGGPVGGEWTVRELDPEALKGNGQCVVANTAGNGSSLPEAPAAAESSAGFVGATVDVLVVYTPGTVARLGGRAAVVAKAQAGINGENGNFARSGITPGMRLVHTREVNHAASGSLVTDLGWVQGSSEVSTLRNLVGADLVALMSDLDNSGTYGVANLLSSTNGQPNNAFSANFCDTFSGVWPHEAGHNLGCMHNDTLGETGLYPYSFGHYWTYNSTQYGSIMSYIGQRIAYFSNPTVSWNGNATGVANDRDNARTVNNSGAIVAAYRASKLLMDAALALDADTANPPELAPIDLTLTVTNAGPETASNIVVTAILPVGLTYLGHSGSGIYVSGSGVWTVPTLAASAGATLTIQASANVGTRGTSLVVTGSVTSVGSAFVDFDYYNNSASVTIQPVADLSTVFRWTNGVSGNWSSAVNWTNNLVPPVGGSNNLTLQFIGGGSYTASNDLAGTFDVNTIEFTNSQTTNVTLTGNPLRFPGGSNSIAAQIIQRGNAAATIQNRLLLQTDLTLVAPVNKQVTFTGSVGGAGGLVKSSANKVALNVSNDFSGAVTLNGGSIELNHLQALAQAAGASVAAGAHLDLKTPGSYPALATQITGNAGGAGALQFNQATTSTYTWPGRIALAGDARLGTYGVNITVNLSGAISGVGDLSFYAQGGGATHTGTFVISGSNSWNGATTIDAGTAASAILKLGATNALPVTTSVTLNSATNGVNWVTTAQLDLNGQNQQLAGLLSSAPTNSVVNSSGMLSTLTLDLTSDFDFNGGFSGNLALVKNGPGDLRLSGIAQHSGGTTLGSGLLRVDTALRASAVTAQGGALGGTGFIGVATLAGGGLINAGSVGAAGTLTFSNLTCTGGTLEFDLTNSAAVGAGVNDLLEVTNVILTAPTIVSVNWLATNTASRYVLIRYRGVVTGTNLLALSPVLIGARNQAAFDFSVPGEIALIVNSGTPPKTLTWRGDGATNAWNLNLTTNWTSGASTPETFFNGDTVLFTGTGSNTPSIALTGNLAPASVTVNATVDYTFTGGSLVGPADLTKSGSGTLTMASANSFAGGSLAVQGGKINVNHASAFAGLGSGNVASGAQLLATANGTYASLPVTITGNGTDNQGALRFNRNSAVITWPGAITLGGNARIGAYSGGGTYNLGGVISGQGDMTFFAGGSSATHNHFFVLQSPCSYSGSTTLDTYAANSRVRLAVANALPTATVVSLNAGIWNTTNFLTAQLELRGFNQTVGGLTTGSGAFGTGGTNRVVNGVGAPATLTVNNDSDFTFSGFLGGPVANENNFSVTKSGAGTLTLSASNTFTGALLVSDGKLALGSTGHVASATWLNIAAGGVLDVSAVSGGFDVAAGQKLGGSGVIMGLVRIKGTLAPGASVGALTISNALTLNAGSATVIEVDPAAGTNDSVRGLTSVAYGGTLNVSNVGGAFGAGQSFKIFYAPTYSGAFAAINLPLLSPGLAWTNRLTLDGSLGIYSTVPATPPTLSAQRTNASTLVISWPTNYAGYYLQGQTNALSTGLGTNWLNVPGGSNTPVVVPIVPGNGAAFFRLRSP